MQDLTGNAVNGGTIPMITDSMSSGGEIHASLGMTAPGSTPVSAPQAGTFSETPPPFPIDSFPSPLPVNTPVRPWEQAAPPGRPGGANWKTSADFTESPGWQSHPNGQAS